MKYHAGLDISMKTTAICVVDNDGEIVFEDSVPTEPKLIDMCLKSTGFSIEKIALETGSLTHWLAKELVKLGRKVTCFDARTLSKVLLLNSNKTDRNDARGIAEALRTNNKKAISVYQKSQQSVEIGVFLATRRSLINQRTKASNTVRGLLKAFGIRLGTTKKDFTKTVREKTIGMQDIVKSSLEALLKMFDNLNAEIENLNEALSHSAKKDEVVKRLMSIPGVGPVTASLFKSVIDDPSRFKDSRSIGAYLGMTPKQRSSGEVRRIGSITKCGSRELRAMLSEAALVLLTCCKQQSSLKTWGQQIVEKHGYKKATVAVGRKLAVIMHSLWKNKTIFKPGNIEITQKD
jgi:transposase